MFSLGKKLGTPLSTRGSTEVFDPDTAEAVGRAVSPIRVRRERRVADERPCRDDDANERKTEGAADMIR
jgi:hypothetical protein